MVIHLLGDGPKTIGELQEGLRALGFQVPRRTLYWHLERLRGKGLVDHLGKGRGYCLGDPMALRKFYRKLLDSGEILLAIKMFQTFVEAAVGYPSRSIKTGLAIKAQEIILKAVQLTFIDSILAASAVKDEYEEEKVIHLLADLTSELARLSLRLLKESKSIKLRRMLSSQGDKLIEGIRGEARSYTKLYTKEYLSELSRLESEHPSLKYSREYVTMKVGPPFLLLILFAIFGSLLESVPSSVELPFDDPEFRQSLCEIIGDEDFKELSSLSKNLDPRLLFGFISLKILTKLYAPPPS
jgi:DNA-binding transcriptional ArsR family regulator